MYIVTTRGTIQLRDNTYVGGILAGLPPSKLPSAVAEDDDDLLIAVPKDPVVEKVVKDSSFACGVDWKNALSFVTCSLANFATTKLMLSMARLSEPLEKETRKDLVHIKTRMGSFSYSVSLASGEYVKLLQATFMNLENHDFLVELGMKTALDVFSDGTLKEDEVLSESAIDYCRELVSAELVSSACLFRAPAVLLPRVPQQGRPGLQAGCTTRCRL